LGQLRRMPMMELKIDQSFVRDLAQDADDVVLVRTAIDLGHHHGTVVVAEGVEDVGALAILRDLGCDVAQGFLLARPVPPDQLFEVCERASTIMRQALASRPDGVPRQRAQPSAAIGTAHRSGG
jgi:EAL domain-containing protein (putative c-di-GMP-specific phosphodiesterase class I)